MRFHDIYNLGLISLLAGCAPKTSMIYMNTEINSPYTDTYAISDHDNKIKREILETEGDVRLHEKLKETLMSEANRRGLVVEMSKLEDRTDVTIFFPILQKREDSFEEYTLEGYFVKRMVFSDYYNDGSLDGLTEEGKLKLRNTIRAAEMILRQK